MSLPVTDTSPSPLCLYPVALSIAAFPFPGQKTTEHICPSLISIPCSRSFFAPVAALLAAPRSPGIQCLSNIRCIRLYARKCAQGAEVRLTSGSWYRMQLTVHATHRTSHGASLFVQASDVYLAGNMNLGFISNLMRSL